MNERIETTILNNLFFQEDYTRKVLPFLKEDYFPLRTEKILFSEIVKFVQKYNNLPIVIDHISKPKILNQEIDEWKADMKKLSMLDNIFCKYSGIVTEIGEDYSLEQIKPYTDFIFEIFDTTKIMWGSDWPVLTMAEKYENWFDIAHTLIPNLSNDERMNVFSHTARNFYKI